MGWFFFPFLLRSYFWVVFFFFPTLVCGRNIWGGTGQPDFFYAFQKDFFLGWNGEKGGLVDCKGGGGSTKAFQNVLNY